MHQTHDIIASFDRYLEPRGLHFDAVVIGGAALNLLGVGSRLTEDCDILFQKYRKRSPKPHRLSRVRSVGMVVTLPTNGSTMDRLRCKHSFCRDGRIAFRRHFLVGLSACVPSNEKIFLCEAIALCDRGIDLPDCVALAPDQAELDKIVPWLERQDANPQWPTHVRVTIADLTRRLGYALP